MINGKVDKIKLGNDEEEVSTPLRRCKCTREKRRHADKLGIVRIVTSKMSCAQVRERELCCGTLRGKHKGQGKRRKNF
jgi:hypothetical protein